MSTLYVFQVQDATNPYDYHWTVVAVDGYHAEALVREHESEQGASMHGELQVFNSGLASEAGVKVPS